MIVTDQFVFLHFPKTGGTFVADSLFEIHQGKWGLLQLMTFLLNNKARCNSKNHPLGPLFVLGEKHAGVASIGAENGQKIIFSSIRNPLDYYVSAYEFAWWKRKIWRPYYLKIPGFKERYSDFPNLDFSRFLQLQTEAFNPPGQRDFFNKEQFGPATQKFIKFFFFTDPELIFHRKDLHQLTVENLQKLMPKVHFLHTESLNKDLSDFLKNLNYPASEIAYLLDKKRVLPGGKGRNAEQKWERYYTAELKNLIIKKDRLLFDFFPNYR